VRDVDTYFRIGVPGANCDRVRVDSVRRQVGYLTVGYLPPRDARKLYLALIDPHLIAGCEISPDIDPSLLKLLEDVQHRFIRRCILRVSDTCLTVALFTETAIMPIRYRRLIITLKYLIYLLQLDNDRLARGAERLGPPLDP